MLAAAGIKFISVIRLFIWLYRVRHLNLPPPTLHYNYYLCRYWSEKKWHCPKNRLLIKNPQFSTQSLWTSLNEYQLDWAKIVDFLLMKYYWSRVSFFRSVSRNLKFFLFQWAKSSRVIVKSDVLSRVKAMVYNLRQH